MQAFQKCKNQQKIPTRRGWTGFQSYLPKFTIVRYVAKLWMAIAIAKPASKFTKIYFWVAINLKNKNLPRKVWISTIWNFCPFWSTLLFFHYSNPLTVPLAEKHQLCLIYFKIKWALGCSKRGKNFKWLKFTLYWANPCSLG